MGLVRSVLGISLFCYSDCLAIVICCDTDNFVKIPISCRLQSARGEEPAALHHPRHHHLRLQRLRLCPHLLHDLLPQVFKQLVMRKLTNPRINHRFIKPFLTTWCLGLQTAYFSPTFETLWYTKKDFYLWINIAHHTWVTKVGTKDGIAFKRKDGIASNEMIQCSSQCSYCIPFQLLHKKTIHHFSTTRM